VVRARGRLEGDQLPVVDLRRRLERMDSPMVCPRLCLPAIYAHVGDCSLHRAGIQLLVEGKPRFRVEDEVQLHDGEDHYALFPEIP